MLGTWIIWEPLKTSIFRCPLYQSILCLLYYWKIDPVVVDRLDIHFKVTL